MSDSVTTGGRPAGASDEQPSERRSGAAGSAGRPSNADDSAGRPSGVDDSLEPTVDGGDRWWHRLPSPTLLAALGLLGLPSLVVPSLEWTEEFFVFFLFGLWPVVKAVLPSVDGERRTDWIRMGTRSSLSTLVSFAYVQVNPFVQWTAIKQIAWAVPVLLRHRFDPPDAETFEQTVDYRLPFEGEWTAVSGGPTRSESHSWGLLTQRYAYDFVVTDEGGHSHESDGRALDDYHCYGEPVVAPADGEVVAASDGHRDYGRPGGWLDPRQRDIRGNYVTVEHADGEYSTLAHLREGSVAVSAGDRVERGERIARCGNSGNSTEPHLHFHVADRPSLVRGMGLPVHFSDVRVREWEGEPTTRERAYVHEGQRVSPAE
ncbi:MAG: M23 family metallopeptidase [Haloarculaceae archaeon]